VDPERKERAGVVIVVHEIARTFEPYVYEGAGHGLLRALSGREGASMRATEQAWPRTIAFLNEHLRQLACL
jgi:dienelactone hydrolase